MEYVSFFLILQQNSETRWFLFLYLQYCGSKTHVSVLLKERKKKGRENLLVLEESSFGGRGRGVWWWSVGNKWVRSLAKRPRTFPSISEFLHATFRTSVFTLLLFAFYQQRLTDSLIHHLTCRFGYQSTNCLYSISVYYLHWF